MDMGRERKNELSINNGGIHQLTTCVVEHISSKNDIWVQTEDRSIPYTPCESQYLQRMTSWSVLSWYGLCSYVGSKKLTKDVITLRAWEILIWIHHCDMKQQYMNAYPALEIINVTHPSHIIQHLEVQGEILS